ncbi:MAG TPA: lytic transglycosylase domain-containing protein [Candidatus Acidoferrales bacterium]|nr:lytic transglycosylase domain-containing protein [Candidatus Acidoferrales bacterium]
MGRPPASAIRESAVSSTAMAYNGVLPPERLEELVAMTAERHHVDPALVRAVVHTESGGNPAAVSSKGAMGLMQLMPQTAQAMGVTNVFSPQDNLDGGVRYLRTLLERYNGDLDLALAAYNAGAGAVDRARGVPHYRQTQDYVRKVTNSYYNGAAAGDRPKTSLKMKSASAGTSVAAAASPPMYQTRDAQGRVVWTNN